MFYLPVLFTHCCSGFKCNMCCDGYLGLLWTFPRWTSWFVVVFPSVHQRPWEEEWCWPGALLLPGNVTWLRWKQSEGEVGLLDSGPGLRSARPQPLVQVQQCGRACLPPRTGKSNACIRGLRKWSASLTCGYSPLGLHVKPNLYSCVKCRTSVPTECVRQRIPLTLNGAEPRLHPLSRLRRLRWEVEKILTFQAATDPSANQRLAPSAHSTPPSVRHAFHRPLRASLRRHEIFLGAGYAMQFPARKTNQVQSKQDFTQDSHNISHK